MKFKTLFLLTILSFPVYGQSLSSYPTTSSSQSTDYVPILRPCSPAGIVTCQTTGFNNMKSTIDQILTGNLNGSFGSLSATTATLGSVNINGGTLSNLSSFNLSTAVDASTIIGNNAPFAIKFGPITGQYPNGNPHIGRFDCGIDTATSTSSNYIGSCIGIFETFGGAGTTGTRTALDVGSLVTGVGSSATSGFLLAGQFRATADAPLGGVYPTAAGGAIDTFSTYAIGTSKSGYLTTISTEEANWEQMYGGAAVITFGKEFARLGQDWGIVQSQSNNDFQGRYSLWLTSQPPSLDTTSIGSVIASAGQNLPGFRSQIAFGGGNQESTFDPNFGSIMFSFPQIYVNNNGCTAGVTTNCNTTIGPAIIKPQILWDGFQLGNIHFNNEVIRSPGFVVKGTGEVDIGSASITPTTTGVTIDANGSYITGATYVSGNIANKFQVGEYLYGSYVNGTIPGAILRVTSVLTSGGQTVTTSGTMGTPNGLAVVDRGYSNASAATNNASTTMGTAAQFMGHGTNTVTLTWADIKDTTSNVATVAIAPTNGVAKLGGSTYLTGGTNGSLAVTGAINAGKNIVSGSTSGFVGGTGGLLFPNGGGNGGYGGVGINSNAFVFKNYAGTIAGSFDMNMNVPNFVFNNETNFAGPIHTSGTVPTIVCSGGSGTPNIDTASTQTAGYFQVGTNNTSCTITWPSTLAHNPKCTTTGSTATVFPYFANPPTNTSMTVNFSAAYSGSVSYICIQ